MSAILTRRVMIVGVLLLMFSLVATATVNAQDGARQLVPGEPVTGTLDAENFAESYIFSASEGDTITLRATTTDDLTLALLLTDPEGQTTSAAGEDSAILSNYTLPKDGTYVVTVLRGTGAEGDASGEYTLSLVGDITPPATSSSANQDEGPIVIDGNDTYISLPQGGIEFQLTWFSAVDLNLEVRDPVGGALYFDNLTVPSGGEHGGNVNDLCDDATSDSPTETVTWPQGFVPAGSYEVIIYYQNPCTTGGPQTFELSVSVNGEDARTITGVVNPGQRYLARVELDTNRTWTLFNGGVDTGQLDLSRVANPFEAEIGQTYSDTITNDNPKDAYVFEGTAGQTLDIAMNATSGSLDTLLIVLDPEGRRIADNDDANDSTNSFLTITLPTTGEYTVLATRYGQVIGGTEGNYTLTIVNSASSVVDADDVSTTDEQPVTTTIDATPQGSIEVTLTWQTNADLQLLVRDPTGESIFDDNPNGLSGGILDQDRVGNRGCVNTTTSPISYIYWPANRVPPSGTYEVEVWYQSDCDDPRPVSFDLSIEVDGLLLAPPGATSTVTSTATAVGNRFMITFTYDQVSGTVALGDGGFFNMDSPSGLNYRDQLSTAQLIELNDTVQGRIDPEQPFAIYRFNGQAGDRIGIQVQRLTGTLDTAVYLLDANGVLLVGNDDVEPGVNTNSQITEYTLSLTGTYYIIVSHYGLQYGGTSGDYQLVLASFGGAASQ